MKHRLQAFLNYITLPVVLGLALPASVSMPVAAASAPCSENNCDLIDQYINPGINVLSGLFGLVAVASIIIAGIQYSASEGDPQKASQAKNRMTNTIIAVVAYGLLYGFLQFLLPGGLLSQP